MPSNPKVPATGQPSQIITAAQILKIGEVCSITRLSRATVYRLAANSEFPSPRKLGARASGWFLRDVEDWLASRTSGIRIAA